MGLLSPARKIGTMHWVGVRGVTQEGQQYESLLEHDYLSLLRFDNAVKSYRTQPCQIAFSHNDKPHTYTPDVLVEFHDHLDRSPELIEVKPQYFIDNAEIMMAVRFSAASLYSEERGWLFRVVTERDMPRARVDNARFLLRYLKREPDGVFSELCLQTLAELEQVSIEGLLQACQRDDENRARLLTEVWTLIALRRVEVDLDKPLTMQSTICTCEMRQ